MAFRSYDGFGAPTLTPWVKRLLIANTAVFLALWILRLATPYEGQIAAQLVVWRETVLTRPWTLVTYAFVHDGPLHLLFNMLALFFFGGPLEERWGGRGFLRFAAVCAAGAGLASLLVPAPVMGFSGVAYGLMLAYAMAWPDNQVYVLGIFPVKVKWLVVGLGAISLLSALDGSGAGTSHLAHLGGLATGFALLKSPWAPNPWGNVVPAQSRKKSPVLSLKSLARRGGDDAPRAPSDARVKLKAERELHDEVDKILDKISQQGLASLSEQELARLNEVSRRYRTN
jgi:membrane associated rhomboid family serine protease